MSNIKDVKICLYSDNKDEFVKFEEWFSHVHKYNYIEVFDKTFGLSDAYLKRYDDHLVIYANTINPLYKEEILTFLAANPEYTKGINLLYSTMEPYFGVFINTDKERRFIKDEYYLEATIFGDEDNNFYGEVYSKDNIKKLEKDFSEWLGEDVTIDNLKEVFLKKYPTLQDGEIIFDRYVSE